MSEERPFRAGSLEKTNVDFALFADIRFFVKPACEKISNQVAKFSWPLHLGLRYVRIQ